MKQVYILYSLAQKLSCNCYPPRHMYAQHTVVDKPAKTQTSIQLASYLVKTPYSYSEDVSLNPLCGHEFETLKRMGYSLLQW
jgi:hypothetical protein